MRHSLAVLLVLPLLLSACGKKTPPTDATPIDAERTVDVEQPGDTDVTIDAEVPGPGGTIAALAADAGLEATACETASDCVISCINDGMCCGQLCGCTNVYNVSFLEKLQAQREASCVGARCPIASCAAPTETPVAVCNEGQCAVQMRPLVAVPDLNFEPPAPN